MLIFRSISRIHGAVTMAVVLPLATLCLLPVSTARSERILLDETAAVVSARLPSPFALAIITRSELEGQCRLEAIRRYGKEGLDREISKALRREVLELVVEESMLFLELSRLGPKEPDKSLVEERLEHLGAPLGGAAVLLEELQRRHAAPQQVLFWVKRSLLVEEYIEAQYRMLAPAEGGGPQEAEAKKRKFRADFLAEIAERYRIWMFVT